MTVPDNVVELDRQAVRASERIVAGVAPADLDRRTPCAAWSLRELLGHMTAQHVGFAAAAAGAGDDLAHWRVPPGGDDIVSRYVEAAERVLAAFAADGVLAGRFALAELGATFPADLAISFHLVDYVVHTWDVASSLGVPVDFGPDLLDAALEVARQVPDGPNRLRPGAGFAPALTAPAGASTLEEILTLLGRCTTWPEPSGRSPG